MILLTLAMLASALPNDFVLDNRTVSLTVSRKTGEFSLKWADGAITGAHGEATTADGTVHKTTDFSVHEIESRMVSDRFGKGEEVIIRHGSASGLCLRQAFWVYAGKGEVFVRLGLIDPSGHGTNRIAPLVIAQPARIIHDGPLHSLFVPYDNDNYFRYSSEGWGEGEGNGDGSYEVGALYDDSSRRGLLVGSVDHDLWKSAVRFSRDGSLRAVAGVTSKYTHDKEPHGTVTGREVSSPRFVVSMVKDWREGLERYAELNAIVRPPLTWKGAVPFGWNSWSGHKNKVTAHDADTALEFIDKDLPWFRSGGTAYLNFDSFWDNLSREQRVDFCRRAHAAGLKAGIYWTPFVNWGEPDWKTVANYHFRDLQLKNERGELLPKLDGGWPLDPTHPGTLARIDENIKDFVDQGFDYIKLDFLTHGSLEGRHSDSSVPTGTAAYRVGMQRIVDDLARANRPVFISLSIAPMFPHGYAHSRRISCDVFSNIGASEYFLNSQNYGWWTADRLYRFNDPDSACEYQALGESPTTDAEARTRFTASVIGGGMMIEGDNLTLPAARSRVHQIFSNRAALELAKLAPQFRPVRGDTGEKAGDAFVFRQNKDTAYVAAFNFDKTAARTESLELRRLGLAPGKWSSDDLWTGKKGIVGDVLGIELAPTDSALLRLTRIP